MIHMMPPYCYMSFHVEDSSQHSHRLSFDFDSCLFFMCSLLNFSDMSKHSLVSSFVVVVVGLGEGRGGSVFFFFFFFFLLDGKSVMSMFCNVLMLLLLYVHVCVTRTGWKTRP